MREILFRGKRKDNGEWIVGADIMHKTIRGELCLADIGKDWISVDPSTFGQYTGLTDKNGRKIFEGDILKGYLDDEFPQNCTIALVVWFGFGWFTKEQNCCPDPLEKNDGKVFEVIGSIYENPELFGRW